MKRFLPLIFLVCACLLPLFAPSCANTTQAPSGGKKDTIPPLIIDIKPLPGAVRVPTVKTTLVFSFNEYFNVKTPGNIFLSPPLQHAPKTRVRGRDLIVTFEDTLAANTTYTLNFTDAIADANEGNMFPGYTYVFSTGEQIDSMMMTGTVRDCNTLAPVKGATVLLYKDLADSAVLRHRPYAAVKTDDWGFFVLPFIQDTVYRIYAIKDANNNNIYEPETETVGFIDSLIRPVLTASDTVPEILKYDMLDTVRCLARRSEHELKLFREKPTKQYIVNKVRTSERSAYLTFMAPGAWIDSLWIRGYRADQVISQFNILQDSLELWINSRRAAPDTMSIYVNYRKTDSLGRLSPAQEIVKLPMTPDKRTYSKPVRRNLKHDDTVCVYKLSATPETVEQNGFELEFRNPIIWAEFDSLQFFSINTRQRQERAEFTVEQDSLNLRRYILRPKDKLLPGFEYTMRVPYRAFRDINGFWSDSTRVKVSLPKDEALSSLDLELSGVDRKLIVDLLGEKRDKALRTFVIDRDGVLHFPYLRTGRYSIRITEDGNRNSIVDTGSLLEHRQPEKVVFLDFMGSEYLSIPASVELSQSVYVANLFQNE
ncbi:Ig-like domain-containing protein [Bacteroidales bacterium WCE2004]|nr:Ig-like domain-containing protein [Bacteroidales bacterium WCE2004]